MGIHVSVVIHRVFVRSFNRACVSHHITREKEEGSKSRRPTEARRGQQERENRNSPNQDHHVERNKQTTIKLATYTLRFIIHGYACIRCHRVFVQSFNRACVSHHITRKGVSQGARQRLDRDNKREKTETVQTKTRRGWEKTCVYRAIACEITSGYGGSSCIENSTSL